MKGDIEVCAKLYQTIPGTLIEQCLKEKREEQIAWAQTHDADVADDPITFEELANELQSQFDQWVSEGNDVDDHKCFVDDTLEEMT